MGGGGSVVGTCCTYQIVGDTEDGNGHNAVKVWDFSFSQPWASMAAAPVLSEVPLLNVGKGGSHGSFRSIRYQIALKAGEKIGLEEAHCFCT